MAVRIARAVMVRGFLQMDERGEAPLEPSALAHALELYRADCAFDDSFERARLTLQQLMAAQEMTVHSIALGEPLGAAFFANAVRLDPLQGRFVPDLGLQMCGCDWDQARSACAESGQVRVAAADIIKLIGNPGVAAIRRAEDDLRPAWVGSVAGHGAMPKRSEGVPSGGEDNAGSQHAAGKAWSNVAADYPELSKPGPRPKFDPQ